MKSVSKCSIVVLGCLAANAVQAQFSFTTGVEYSTGSYGSSSKTDITTVPFTLRYDKGPWAIRLSSSWLSIAGDGVVVPVLSNDRSSGGAPGRSDGSLTTSSSGGGGFSSGGGSPSVVLTAGNPTRVSKPGSGSSGSSGSGSSGSGSSGSGSSVSGSSGSGSSGSRKDVGKPVAAIVAPRTTSASTAVGAPTGKAAPVAIGESVVPLATARTRSVESGMGDLVLAGTYRAYENDKNGVAFDVTARIKFGTASVSKGLGSGQTDYSLKADLYKDWTQWSAFGTYGIKRLGSNGTVTLRDVQFGAVGAAYQITQPGRVSVALDFATAARAGMPNPLELSVSYRHKIGKSARLTAEVARGLSDASAAYSAAITFGYFF